MMRSLGTAVLSGMITATLLAIFVVPVLYVLIEGFVARLMRDGMPSARTWRWAWLANAASYGLIMALLIAVALLNARR